VSACPGNFIHQWRGFLNWGEEVAGSGGGVPTPGSKAGDGAPQGRCQRKMSGETKRKTETYGYNFRICGIRNAA